MFSRANINNLSTSVDNTNTRQPRPLSGSNPARTTNQVQNQATNSGTQNGEINTALDNRTNTTAGADPLPAGWEKRYTLEGRLYYLDHNIRTTTWVDPRCKANDQNKSLQPQTTASLGPLPSGWEMRPTSSTRIHFIDHNTRTTTWDDPRIPPLDVAALLHKRDFRRKLIYFRSQPAMRTQPGNCQMVVGRNHIFDDSYAKIMRHTPNNLKKQLTIVFDGEDDLNLGDLSRCVAPSHA